MNPFLVHNPEAPAGARNDSSSAMSEGLLALDNLAKAYSFEEIIHQVDQGKSAIWGGMSWEAPLIYACDTIPVRMSELWRKRSHEYEAIGENQFQIPGEYCSMVKALIGSLHLRRDEKIKRILCFGGTCEPIANVLELAKPDGYDVHCIENISAFKPEDRRPEHITFLASELQKVALWLTGLPVDENKLRSEIRKKNLIAGKVRQILDLRLKSPLFLKSRPTLQLLGGSTHYFGNPAEFIRVLDLLIGELAIAAETTEAGPFIPLVLAGGDAGSNGILNVIEESNSVILGWVAFSTGSFREDMPPLESMAHYLLDIQSRGELGEGAGTSAALRRFRIEQIVKSTQSRGIIASAITGCPFGSIVQQIERAYFKQLRIPYLALESNVHKERPSEEQVMRVKTFIEMLS
jgi:benzoyl-CoA reductase/2-hydroxyglutaryl-CoA dehydratase subunit BcrC/BadD/HgdB